MSGPRASRGKSSARGEEEQQGCTLACVVLLAEATPPLAREGEGACTTGVAQLTRAPPLLCSFMAITEQTALLLKTANSPADAHPDLPAPAGLDPRDLTPRTRAGLLAGIWTATFLASLNSEQLG